MARVLVSDPIHPDGLARLREHGHEVVQVLSGNPEDLLTVLPEVEAWLVRSRTRVTAELLSHARKLKIVVRVGVGLDNVDHLAASRQGILVTNTPRATTVSVAEFTLAMILSLVREIPQASWSLRQGKWEKKRFVGAELAGKTLGILGLGRIGLEVARRALAMGMNVMGYRRSPLSDEETRMGILPASFDEILSRSDFISIHLPLTEETRHLLSREAFDRMKAGVYLVNCARGGIVDEEALLSALDREIVRGAALDVFETEPPPPDHPLLSHPRVIATPHIAAQTEEAQRRAALEAADKVIATLGGEDALG